MQASRNVCSLKALALDAVYRGLDRCDCHHSSASRFTTEDWFKLNGIEPQSTIGQLIVNYLFMRIKRCAADYDMDEEERVDFEGVDEWDSGSDNCDYGMDTSILVESVLDMFRDPATYGGFARLLLDGPYRRTSLETIEDYARTDLNHWLDFVATRCYPDDEPEVSVEDEERIDQALQERNDDPDHYSVADLKQGVWYKWRTTQRKLMMATLVGHGAVKARREFAEWLLNNYAVLVLHEVCEKRFDKAAKYLEIARRTYPVNEAREKMYGSCLIYLRTIHVSYKVFNISHPLYNQNVSLCDTCSPPIRDIRTNSRSSSLVMRFSRRFTSSYLPYLVNNDREFQRYCLRSLRMIESVKKTMRYDHPKFTEELDKYLNHTAYHSSTDLRCDNDASHTFLRPEVSISNFLLLNDAFLRLNRAANFDISRIHFVH
jgi:hypothetical protein